jgi:basic amino acid/polyamine antiporter, APA family
VTSPQSTLFRGLSRLDIAALTLNNVVGAGIFALPATLAAAAGNMSLWVLIAGFVLFALIALCTAEVASRYDATGGPMYYASSAFGPTAGFAVGWLMYLSRLSSFGAIAVIMLDYAAGLWPVLSTPLARALAITTFIVLLAGFNIRGVVHGALISNVLTVAKVLPMLALGVAGLFIGNWITGPGDEHRGIAALSNGLLLALFACMGFEQAAVVAGEARNPNRDLPIGMLSAFAVVGFLYVLLLLACFALVPDVAATKRPLADAAASLVGPIGALAMSVTAAISCAGSLSVAMMVAPRVVYALAEQGDLPRQLAGIQRVRRTPAAAIVVTAIVLWLLTLSGTFVYLATFAVIARMLMYASTCAALVKLRRRDGPAPLTIRFGPLLAGLSILCCAAILATAKATAVRDVALALLAGWILRVLVRKQAGLRTPAVAQVNPPEVRETGS